MESTIGCKVEDVIDLSADIVWTQIEMDGEEESNGEDEEVKRCCGSFKSFVIP